MPDKEKVVPKKGASKKEPKKPPRRKPKKSADEPVTEQTGVEIPPESDETTEVGVVPSDDQVDAQESPVDSTSSAPIASWTDPDFLSCGDEFIDEAVQFINEKANEALYNGSVEVGAYILKNFFDDNVQAATSRNPRKPVSYNKLCQHPELVVKPERLGVMVRVAAQEKFFADENVNTEGLSYSLKAELVKLRNNQEKIGLVGTVLEEGWSVRDLKRDIAFMRQEELDEKPISESRLLGRYVRNIVSLQGELSDSRAKDLFHDETRRKDLLKLLKGKTRRQLLQNVVEATGAAEEWLRSCEDLKRDLEEIETEKGQKKTKKS